MGGKSMEREGLRKVTIMENISYYGLSGPPKLGLVSAHMDFKNKFNRLRFFTPKGVWHSFCGPFMVNNNGKQQLGAEKEG
jgi:hypothetical protein